MADEFSIVPMASIHVEEISRLDGLCYGEDEKWPVDSYLTELERGYAHYLVVLKDEQIIGVGGVWVFFDQAEISTIFMDPSWQGRGLGSLLFAHLVKEAIEWGADEATLEVRNSNLAAIKVYEKFGFKQIGWRRKYYADGEDARLMQSTHWQSEKFESFVTKFLDDWHLKER